MSIRYSGDAEIRFKKYDRRQKRYLGQVVDPHLVFDGWVPVHPKFTHDPTCSEAYDDAARRLAHLAMEWAKHEKREFMLESDDDGVRIRRGFQAPCPLEDF